MTDDTPAELPGLYAALELVEDRIRDLDEEGRDVTADGSSDAPADGDVTPHEVRNARHGELVAVRDALYQRVTALGGQWPDTEAGNKQPPTRSA